MGGPIEDRAGDGTVFDGRGFLRTVSGRPGVYRMYDADGGLLYIGKARNLKNRLASYFRGTPGAPKVRRMVAQVADVQVTVTGTETEALILEYNLIKEHQPRYNVLLRDDKSYPYIHVSTQDAYPRMTIHRGSRERPGKFFGPYPSASAARTAVNHLQRLFMLRNCDDSFFANRTRPCLQYQIERCSGPCVGLVDEERYRRDVEHAMRFLDGKDEEIIDELAARMEEAAESQEYERAGAIRDQIGRLRTAQERQHMAGARGDHDVVAAVSEGRYHCIAVLFVRRGDSLGTRTYFPRAAPDTEPQEVLSAFLAQHYLGRSAPPEILVPLEVDDADLLEATMSESAGHKVRIRHRVRGERSRWQAAAKANARQSLAMRLASDVGIRERLDVLAEVLGMDEPPTRIECYDISHSAGEAAVGSCVVFTREGFARQSYRKFNVDGVAPGDDYGAMHQVLRRRFVRTKRGENPIPDLVIVDGGQAQLAQAEAVISELGVEGVSLLGVAKGRTRKPGFERVFLSGQEAPTILAADSAGLHLLQQIRDEAHRFAITAHRRRRDRRRSGSALEDIPGLGPVRRRELLRQFGGLKAITRAGVEDLTQVRGISRALAERIYATFHVED